MRKHIITIGCAIFAQVINTLAVMPDWHDLSREIEYETGCTPIHADDAAKAWAKRNGYDY